MGKAGTTWVHRVTDVVPEGETGMCSSCGPVRVYRRRSSKGWACARAARDARLRKEHGIGVDEFDQMVTDQQGLCRICLRGEQVLVVDHDHETGEIRGLLCHGCNRGIGLLREDPETLKRAIAYLERTPASCPS